MRNFPCSIRLILLTVFFSSSFGLAQNLVETSGEKSTQFVENEAAQRSKQWNFASLDQSAALFLQAGKLYLDENNYTKAVECLLASGRVNLILARAQTASESFSKAYFLAEKNKDAALQIEALSELSLFEVEQGNSAKNAEYLRKAESLLKETENPSAKAAFYLSRGEYFYYDRKLSKSIEQFLEGLNAAQNGGDLYYEARILLHLGYAYLAAGEPFEGLKTLENALGKWQTLGSARGQALTYIAIGHISNYIDEKQAAFEAYKKAENLFPDEIDLIEKARLFNGLGKIYEDYEDWQNSLSYRMKALELFRRAHHKFGETATLPSVAMLNGRLFDDQIALDYFVQSEKLAAQLNDQYQIAVIKSELGNFYYQRNDYKNALEKFSDSLAFFIKTKENKEIPLITTKLALIYKKQGKLKEAEKHFSTSLDLNKRIKNKFAEADTLYHLAKLKSEQKQTDEALSFSIRSVESTEELSEIIYNSNLKRNYVSNVFDRYEFYINLLMKKQFESSGEFYAAQALQAAERARARSMLETMRLSETNFYADADPKSVAREREILALLNNKADQLTELLSAEAAETESKRLEDEIDSLRNELEQIRADFKQNSPLYSKIKNPEPFDVAEFQHKFLDENTLLLEFSLGAETSYLWLVGKSELTVYALPPRADLETKIRRLLALLTEREKRADENLEQFQARIASAESEYNQKAGELSHALLGQIEEKIRGKRLLVVPDGILNYFPLAALPLPASGEKLIAANEIVYQPSAATLEFLESAQRTAAPQKNVLVFADGVFSANDPRIAGEGNNFELALNAVSDVFRSGRQFDSLKNLPRLEASLKEAEAIVEIAGHRESTLFSGFDATRERVLQENLADYRVIHFATHGLLNEQHPEFSSIVFSLYDEKGNAQQGFLRLQDIYNLKLSTDLVVLSACESGIGKEIRGEGVIGLTRGFLQAGSRSVLSSLWKVEDQATAELMKHFYENLLNENLAPPEALRRAQLKLSQNARYQSPFYWAGFTVQGEYKNAPAVTANNAKHYFYAGIGICVLLVSCGFLFYRKIYRRVKL